MKTITLILGLLFISFNSSVASAFPIYNLPSEGIDKPVQKADDVFKSFFLHRQQNGVALNWTVTSNNITDFVIQRSYDGEYFDDLDVMVTTVGRWNRFVDNDVFPGYIYYRIVAILNDGSVSYSTVQVVRIVKRH